MIKFSMLRARPLTLFICSVVFLVGGCLALNLLEKTPKCFSPATVAKSEKPCFYILQITAIISGDVSKGEVPVVVQAKVPDLVLKHNAEHSAFTALGGLVGSRINREHYGNPDYEFTVAENPDKIVLKVGVFYEFRGIKGKAGLKVVGDAKLPEDNGADQGKDPDKDNLSSIAGTELYASHSPKCCMCGTCQSGCYCPGQAGCPWCATADVKTLLASVSSNKDTVNVRSRRGLERSSAASGGVAERFLALMSASPTRGNISVKSIATYTYDRKFAPVCLTKSV